MSELPEKKSAPPAEDAAWIAYREMFAGHYDTANYTSPLQRFVMGASHRLTESVVPTDARFGRVIEIGAGTGEHFPQVKHAFDEYVLTDIDAKALDIARQKIVPPANGTVRFEAVSGPQLPYADNSFDRLIATHVLEHIPNPHLAIKEWMRVVKPGGVLSILIPTDPGIAWRLGRHLGPRRSALRLGLAYDYLMAREHVNSCTNLVALLRHYLPERRERWWPLRIPAVDLNLFFLFHAVNPKD